MTMGGVGDRWASWNSWGERCRPPSAGSSSPLGKPYVTSSVTGHTCHGRVEEEEEGGRGGGRGVNGYRPDVQGRGRLFGAHLQALQPLVHG